MKLFMFTRSTITGRTDTSGSDNYFETAQHFYLHAIEMIVQEGYSVWSLYFNLKSPMDKTGLEPTAPIAPN